MAAINIPYMCINCNQVFRSAVDYETHYKLEAERLLEDNVKHITVTTETTYDTTKYKASDVIMLSAVQRAHERINGDDILDIDDEYALAKLSTTKVIKLLKQKALAIGATYIINMQITTVPIAGYGYTYKSKHPPHQPEYGQYYPTCEYIVTATPLVPLAPI